jgi:hypothetical protein
MKIAIKPVVKTFKLAFDEEGIATVTIRQATTGDLVHMDNLFKEQTQIWEDGDFGTIQLKKEFNPQEVKRERAFRTLVGADLEDEDGNAIFRFSENSNGTRLAMSRTEFIKAWDDLPPTLTEEIHDLVQIMTPAWNPNASGK